MPSPNPPTTPPTPAKTKGGKSRLLIMALAVLVVLGGGGAAAFYILHKPAQPGQPVAEVVVVKKVTEPGLLTLEPFTVNLADKGGSRFLRLSVRLVISSPEEAEKAQKNKVVVERIRSSILELLTQQTAEPLVTPEGKAALKEAIIEHVKTVLEDTKVTDVLFSDFVVQF
jgi:flagellar FliL protein